MIQFERDAWAAGNQLVVGIDEAGRGPLAGPVTAGAGGTLMSRTDNTGPNPCDPQDPIV